MPVGNHMPVDNHFPASQASAPMPPHFLITECKEKPSSPRDQGEKGSRFHLNWKALALHLIVTVTGSPAFHLRKQLFGGYHQMPFSKTLSARAFLLCRWESS